MNVLILSCGTGGGHNTAGMAVADELRRRGHTVVFEDAFALVGHTAAKVVNNTYIKTVQYAPKAFGAMYSISETVSSNIPGHSAVYLANSLCTHALKKLLTALRFDAVVMTHIFPAHMLTSPRKRGVTIPTCYLVATDYTCHPFSQEAECDLIVTPSKELDYMFVEAGIPARKLLPLGIPVKCEFSHAISKEAACKELGLSADHRYILLSGGSIGASSMSGSIAALVRYLEDDAQKHLIVICGSNERLYDKLRQNYAGHKQIHIVGKTDKMPLFMKASDVFITKPGGLSTTEAAVSGTPLILMPPIPGCETYNIHFFEKHGMCVAVNDPETELVTALKSLESEDAILHMRHAQHTFINDHSTIDLCDHIEKTVMSQKEGT